MSKPLPDYIAFSITDFVMDPDFVRWVKNPSGQDILFWENWVLQNPGKARVVSDAKVLIRSMRFETDHNTQQNIEETWDILSEKFDQQEQHAGYAVLNSKTRFLNARFLMRFAAVLALVGMTAAFAWFQMTRSATSRIYKTGNGEIATFKLADSSQIVLNANSTLKVTMHKGWNASREAWIEGEAFFRIRKQKTPLRFTVHTSNVDVNVLGTEFNVTDRHNVSTVVLNSGSIKINNTVGKAQDRIMKPGERVMFSDTSQHLNLQFVNPEHYNSWIYKKLVFDHTTISDVAHMLEDNYGFSVVISKPALAKRTFTATLPSDSLPILLKALEESFNVSITQLDKKLVITDK